ncbi:hypothetical protein B0I35DRAFT_342432, partial [Stachybotrys elegans]
MVLLSTMVSPAMALPSLRIMPLGDSITKGNGSSDRNGYRNRLRQMLRDQKAAVDMIGTQQMGSMEDNDHQGHSGKMLADINGYWKESIQARPNVVLVHAGTNNMDLEVDLAGSPGVMEDIIDGLLRNAPDATVVVMPVIWAKDSRMQANTDAFNEKVKSIVETRQSASKHVLLAPTDITADDLSDKKHPNNKGYQKMAESWFEAILEADSKGWLKEPVKVDADDLEGMGLGTHGGLSKGEACSGRIWEKKGPVFNARVWKEAGEISSSSPNFRRDKLHLADLNGDGKADYILADDDGTIRAWLYNGYFGIVHHWKSLGEVNPDWNSVEGKMVRFADVDNDGKADLIVLYSDGAAKVWKNVDNGAKFEPLDSKWATGLAPRDKVSFRDMDGDGYADYVITYSGGAVEWARNTHNNGKDRSKRNWETAQVIAPGPAGIPANSAKLADIDGDGLADYLVVYAGGAVKAFRNTGSLNRQGRNWQDLGTIAPGVNGVTGDMIRFADMDDDGYADFLAVADDGSIRMWKNMGIVGAKGSSLRFADLTGNGKADVIFVDGKGRALAWLNKGIADWESIGEIAPGLDEDLSSARIEFADVNGDKKADYLVIYGGGAVKAYLNNGNIPKTGDGRIWQNALTISPGVGEPGDKVRFADLNGDGYDDYLVIYDGGAVKAWLNNQNIPPKDGQRIWRDGYTVAPGVGEPGSKIRFADLSGDGKAEFIVQYEGGAAKGYFNMGNIPDAGKPRSWVDVGVVAGGVSPQGPVRYADLDGDGKADYLVVFGDGSVNAYINSCDWNQPPMSGGGDNPVGGGGGGSGNGDNPVGEGPPSGGGDEDGD